MEQAQGFFNTDIVNVGCERRLLGKLCQELVEGVPSNAEMVDYRLSLQVEVGTCFPQWGDPNRGLVFHTDSIQ